MLMEAERALIVEYGKKASLRGLCPGTSGNLSVFDPERGIMAISPSGLAWADTRPEDVPVCDLDGRVLQGARRPSSEWALHAIFYRHRSAARAVVHTHSVFCTTLGIAGQALRAVHYVIGDAGTDTVPLAPYRLFGTPELAETALKYSGSARAVLLQNHGLVTWGRDLPDAFSLAENLEYVAELQVRAAALGTARVLTREEMDAVLVRFQTYGQPKT